MSDGVYKLAKAKFLKDSSGNIILPRTTTGLVTDSEGVTLDELLAQRNRDIDEFSDKLNTVERKVNDLDIVINTIKDDFDSQIYDIYGRIGALQGFIEYESSLSMNDVRNIIDVNVDLNNRLGNIENDIMRINDTLEQINGENSIQRDNIENLNIRITDLASMQNRLETLVGEKVSEIEDGMNDIKQSINEIRDIIDTNITPISVLMTIIELYELFATLHQKDLQHVSNYVIDIYYSLYKLDEITLDEMPEHIQDYIHAKILEDELK